jgi:hypothetical protein
MTVPMLLLLIASAPAVTISPIYGPDIWFSVQAHSTDVQTIQGSIAGLPSHSVDTDDTYRQRFVRMEGEYRIIHTAGAEIEHHTENGGTRVLYRPVHDIIRFDLAGIFDTGAGDPIDLIPLYPGHMVTLGDSWIPTAAVKTNYGTGTASYKFHIENLMHSRGGHTIARISVSFTSNLQPLPAFAGGVTEAVGGGWFLWDCTVNQRSETHLHGVYTLTIGKAVAHRFITDNDSLIAHKGAETF